MNAPTSTFNRLMLALVINVMCAVDALRDRLTALEASAPEWAQDKSNRLLVYLSLSCVVVATALAARS